MEVFLHYMWENEKNEQIDDMIYKLFCYADVEPCMYLQIPKKLKYFLIQFNDLTIFKVESIMWELNFEKKLSFAKIWKDIFYDFLYMKTRK